ncbi:neuronal PAS domain-containing protein 4-like, partial [Tachysurus ichikawai]
RSCVCLFRTNRQSCPLLVRLRMFDPQRHLMVALCSPLLRERDSFTTTHTPDMRYTHAHYSVELYLGYEAEELIGRSWYSIIHPDDLLLSAKEHKQLMHCEQVDLVLRVQDKQLNWVWLYIIATRDTESHRITCSNHIISEVVAEDLRHKLGAVSSVSSPPSPSPPVPQNSLRSNKRPAEVSAESGRRKNRRVSTAAASSLPYSPNSSFSSKAQETGNIDFLFGASAVCPIYPSPSQNIQWPSFDATFSTLTPFCYHTELSVSEDHAGLPSVSDSFLYLEDFNSFPALVTGSSRTFHAPEDYGWSGLLTPPPPALRYSEMEQAEISILAQQISSLASSFDSYCIKSSIHHSDHTTGSQSCDPEAFLLDEEVIDNVMQLPRVTLEVQSLEALLDLEKCSEDQQQELSLYSYTQQDGFCDESLY